MFNKAGYIKYKMPVAMAEELLKDKDKRKINVQEYLCQIVNEQFGLKGECVEIILF